MPTLESLLGMREGVRYDVYRDSLKKPTVGIGHLVRPEDKLKIGEIIDDARVKAFFKKDSAAALDAAKSQAFKAGIKDPNFVLYLASVNFQLGLRWYKIHKKAWSLIMEGQYSVAAEEVKKSKWYKQTPKRVNDFRGALLKLKDKPALNGK